MFFIYLFFIQNYLSKICKPDVDSGQQFLMLNGRDISVDTQDVLRFKTEPQYHAYISTRLHLLVVEKRN